MSTTHELLRRAYDFESDIRRQGKALSRYWEFHAIRATRAEVKQLVADGYACIAVRSGALIKYELTEKGREMACREIPEFLDSVSKSEVLEALELVVGFEDIKETLAIALATRRKVNFLLEGPPACAKSVMLEGIRSAVPSAFQAFGSRTSASGLSEALFEYHPQVLLLDEADKMRHDVYSVLLGLMESGEILETKTGKALRNGTNVYTPVGPRPIESLKHGNPVYAVDGNAVPVLGVFPQGEQDIYEVIFSDKQVISCTLDHLWEIKRANMKTKIVDTAELLRISPRLLSRTFIPVAESVQFPYQPVPLDPYALGTLISNGGFTRETLVLSTTEGTFDDPVLTQLTAIIPAGYSFKKTSGGPYDFALTSDYGTGQRHPWITALRELGLWGKYSHEKFIPEIYKYNSEEIRWSLIQGLMDTDGWAEGKNDHRQPAISTSSLQLANDIAEVVESLGGICGIKPKLPSYLNKETSQRVICKLHYIVRITHPDAPKFFRLERKRILCNKKVKPMRRYIDAVRFSGKAQATCIRIDHPRQLFLTEGFIPTHNTRGIKLDTIVIAACNSSKKMSPEFLSRFAFHGHFPEYTREEFIDVVLGMLGRESCPEEIARMIGARVYDEKLGDVRKARGVWNLMMAPTGEEIERVIHMSIKYGPQNAHNKRRNPVDKRLPGM